MRQLFGSGRKHTYKGQKAGQALVEYVLAIILVLGIFFIINDQVNKGIARIWRGIARDVTAGCTGCRPSDSVQ